MAGYGLFSPAPYHILSYEVMIIYGTLYGTTFFHTFIGGIISYQHLPRPFFGSLMSKIFPVYFIIQTVLPVFMAITYPGSFDTPRGIAGVLSAEKRWSVLVPLVATFVTAVANLAVVGPATTKCMNVRRVQEKKDGKKAYDAPPHSQEMQQLNTRFSILHGASSLLNLVGFVAVTAYGFTLAAQLN